jgi:hypothetical protein
MAADATDAISNDGCTDGVVYRRSPHGHILLPWTSHLTTSSKKNVPEEKNDP